MQPILKWAGGKRWLFTAEFVNNLPRYNRYIEPFAGGAAGLFALKPQRGIISDINPALIELYEVVRDHPIELQELLLEHHINHNSDYYYSIRSQIPGNKIERACRTLYLNRTCWNGLYRLNRLGRFNVPKGTKSAVSLLSDNFPEASKLLSRVEIYCCDFEATVDNASDGDLVFVDPPYTVKHNFNGFVKYNEVLFKWTDQIRLKDALVRAGERGAKIVLTNADHFSVKELYEETGLQEPITRQSIISGNATGRSTITELVVRI